MMLITPGNNENNKMDSNGLTAIQKTTAINIALSDPTIKGKLWNHPGSSQIGNVTVLGINGESGFTNLSDMVANVPFQFTGLQAPIENEQMNISVDLNTNKVIGSIWYSYRRFPMDAEIMIPPGAYWYYQLSGGIKMGSSMAQGGTLTMSPSVYDVDPENASIYPTILDEENFDSFLNGTAYHTLEYYNNDVRINTSTDGSTPFSHNWSTQISIPVDQAPDGMSYPNYKIPSKYYMLLKNGDPNRYVSISFRCGPF